VRPTALPGRLSRHVEPADFGGIAQVRHLCAAFDLTRAALYKALCAKPKPAKERPGREPSPTVISNARLLEAIEPLVREHPAWGHRKVWAMLRRWGILVARRRIWAIMHQAGLTFIARARRAEPRRGTVAVEQPNRRWCSDMTTVWTRKDDLGRADAGRRVRLSQRARDWDFQGSGRAGDLSTAGNCARGGIPRSARFPTSWNCAPIMDRSTRATIAINSARAGGCRIRLRRSGVLRATQSPSDSSRRSSSS
jgi:hypothetical protein